MHNISLNDNNTVYENKKQPSHRTSVAAWTIPDTTESTSSNLPTRVRYPSSNQSTRGKVVNSTDKRTRVRGNDILGGGRCGAVCKLFIPFEDNRDTVWDGGTGFLVYHDTLVICAHNVCQREDANTVFHAYDVRVYPGLAGQSEVTTVLTRRACHIAVGWEYYVGGGLGANDLAVITLERPFAPPEVAPILYSQANPADIVLKVLTVVGYPGDLPADPLSIGIIMYECTGPDNTRAGETRLTYKIDTRVVLTLSCFHYMFKLISALIG